MHISLSENEDLQNNTSLKPQLWENNLTEEEIQGLMNSQIKTSQALFRRIRFNYIEHMIDCYKREKKLGGAKNK